MNRSALRPFPSCWTAVFGLLFLAFAPTTLHSQTPASELTLPPSQRVTIPLGAGFPGQNPWLYVKDQDWPDAVPAAAENSFNDSAWTPVGVPYSANLLTSFLNADSGGGDGDLNGTTNWYRLHFTLGSQYAGQKVLVEFEGAHTAAQVFLNGNLLPGISKVTADASASHVVGFIPFLVDLTPYVKTDGTDNVLAVRVSRNATWFEDPGFSEDYRFGQADAGLFRPVDMFITSPVHIPQNIYSNLQTWGTYVATVGETASSSSTAQAASATVEVQTNVLNESATPQTVTLTTQIVDANGNVVASQTAAPQTLQPMTPATFPSGPVPKFDQQIVVSNPTLWYPNNSPYGTPYMYKVYSIVSVNGTVVDAVQSPLGIRTISWDANVPYINNYPMNLWGGSGRYDYPALGSSVPEEQQWRDLKQMHDMGGNLWRPGHSTSSEEFVNAADAYGIFIDQPSGEGEGAFSDSCTTGVNSSTYCDSEELKLELHRDMIIRDRSHPSILDWEANNGPMDTPFAQQLQALVNTWDSLDKRVQADRTPNPANGYILGCTLEGCEVGVKQEFPNNPAWGAEYWGTGTARGLAYDSEIAFVAPFIDNWRKGREANAFGMVQWYFADTPGEDSLYAEFQQYANTSQASTYQQSVRSLGASMVDMNRFPKLLYYVYQAAWQPFSLNPVVHLAHTWNRAYEAANGPIQVNAFSNCPAVNLLLNGQQVGAPTAPNPWNSDSGANLTESTTLLPFQVSWQVTFQPGTLTAQCLDQYGAVKATDTLVTAGNEDHIVLSLAPELSKPDGTSFALTADGSDAAFIEADVVDANGNLVPTASDNLTFAVSGPATYMGGSEQYVSTNTDAYSTANGELHYHAPGDPQLQVEGGKTKIALRSAFTTGAVTVTATAPGLGSGSVTYSIGPVPNTAAPVVTGPSVIIPPQNLAVTAGQPASFSFTVTGSAPLSYQWNLNGTPIAGATAGTYSIAGASTAQSGNQYSVTVTNSQGSVTAGPATLTVDPAAAPAITGQTGAQTVVAGATVSFAVTATGSPTLTYQWNLNGAAIPGATQPTFSIAAAAAANSGAVYTVTVSNPVASVTSSPMALTVTAAAAPSIVQQPASLSVLANGQATFTVQAAGSAPMFYQWQFNGVSIAGATSASYTVSPVQADNAGSYTVAVTNAGGSATSAPASLTLAPPGINLALGQPALASSSQDPVGLAPALAFDGNLSTRWGSAQGIDPSWIQVDLGSVVPFNEVALFWDPAYASQFEIESSNDQQTWTPTLPSVVPGTGGNQTVTFPTVQARYVRMLGLERGSQYGYSLDEMQVYNVPTCTSSTDANERYSVLSSGLVLDNLSQLTWQRAQTTSQTAGGQFTQVSAQNYCSEQKMRLPTESEALAISGVANASCAFPQQWSTWTSTPDPNNSNNAILVTSSGSTEPLVADNYPGAVVCVSGVSVPPPTIVTQPQPQTVAAGSAATFTVNATANGPVTYQWYANGTPVVAAINASYTTPATTGPQNNAQYSVVVIGPTNETTTSAAAALTVNGTVSGGGTGTGSGAGGGTGTGTGSGGGSTSTPAPPFTGIASTDVFAVAAGNSSGTGDFAPDAGFSGGGTYSNFGTGVSTAGVANAAPEAVYQSERAGVFTYTLPNLTAGANYTVRLHFAEFYWTLPGQRVFNVAINGTTVLPNFDIVAAAGPDNALVESFPATANLNGQIVIAFTAGSADQPKLSGLELLPGNTGPVASTPPTIATQPANQTVTIGTTAQFTVTPGGTGTFTYQWSKNGTAIPGANAATYITPGTSAADNNSTFSVAVSNSAGPTINSNPAGLTVNSSPAYTVVPGYIVTDLNNNTRGQYADSQVYVEILGNNANGQLSWVNFNGAVTPVSLADNTASNAITGPNGQTYPNYFFTLAQAKQLQLPPLSSGRIFVSLGSPLYMSIVGTSGSSLGYAGPNPLNNTDPNINVHYDWYEFTYGSGGLFINTTQVDQFGLPMLLDVWGSVNNVSEAFHMQTGINEPIAQVDQEYAAQTPAAFHLNPVSPLRILSPANSTFNTGEPNATYFDSYIANIWSYYATNPLTLQLDNGTRHFTGATSGSQFVFTETNLNNGAYQGGTYTLAEPTTQDIFYCNGAFALGSYNSTESAIGAQFCAAFNRAVMGNYTNWTLPATYYQQAPANFYAQFWHNHSIGGLAYGFAYDDVNNQSSTVTTGTPEHMAFGIGW